METDFRSLPDSMEADELEEYFNCFLSEHGKKSGNLNDLKQLYELAYRQWNTYEPLNGDIAEKVEAYLMSSINLKSYDVTDVILSIVENLSLKNVFHYITDSKSSVSSSAILRLINEAEEEYADSIDNPYSDDDDDWL